MTWISQAVSGDIRLYRVTDDTPVVVSVTGRGGKRHTTFSAAGSAGGRYFQDFNRGRAVVLKHQTGQLIEFPRTFKGLSHSLSTSLPTRLDENSHTMVYSQARTLPANDAGKTAGEVVADITAELEAGGYVETPPAIAASTFAVGSIIESIAPPISISLTNAP